MFDLLKSRRQRVTAEKNLKIYNSMLDVADVKCGYEYWRAVLIDKIIRMFEYKNLPATIPGTELEKIVLLIGHAGIVSSPYGYVAVPCSPYGVGIYPSYYPFAVWATPLISGEGDVNDDIVIIKNDVFMRGVDSTIRRYARMLADTESTLALTLVNVRQPSQAAAPDENTAASWQAVQLALRLGDSEAILNKSILNDIKMIDAVHTIPTNLLRDVIDARDELLSQFMAEFGVATRQSKRAPMTVSEVESDTQVMTVNVTDMLQTRKECIDNLNTVFGLNVSVDINPAYKPIIERKPDEFNETKNPYTGQSVTGGDNEL